MNQATQLKLQSYLDGELGRQDRRRMERRLAQDPETRQLCDELRQAKALLADNELSPRVPETRDFYWSKIARAINAATPATAAEGRRARLWTFLRWVAPFAGVALLLAALPYLQTHVFSSRHVTYASKVEQLDDPPTERSSITFRSETESMTVVWVQNRWDMD